jgi:hypothetical protein
LSREIRVAHGKSRSLWLRAVGLSFALSFTTQTDAAQTGPHIPTHHYPTDTSFHLAYRFSLINSSSNFVERLLTDTLRNESRLRIRRHEFIPEFQPNRKFSIGMKVVLDQIGLLNGNDGTSISRTALGDQILFSEFRVLDEPGSSLGFAGLVKVPAYSNPTLAELEASTDPTRTILPGDAQIDTTLMLTSEYWAGTNLRFRGDVGYTIRLDGYAPELPYNVSVGVVNPKMDLELRLRGNFALGAGIENDADAAQIRRAFADSDYAYSPNPWVMVIEPAVELWLSAKFAATFQYSYSIMGNRSPAFHAMGAGMIYRWAETRNRPRRSFREVPIHTDQEAGRFDGDATMLESESLYMDSDPVFEE